MKTTEEASVTHGKARGGERQPSLFRRLGPGLLTGVADDDPSGIATYTQAGSQFGYNVLWSAIITIPLMVCIQVASAHIGRGAGHGILSEVRKNYSRATAIVIATLIVIANVINVGADLAAMGDATAEAIGGKNYWYAVLFAALTLVLQVRLKYEAYARYLKWLTLALFAYIANLFVIHTDWRAALHAIVLPTISPSKEYATTLVAILGTTISPYLFVWQSALEVEEIEARDDEHPVKRAAHERDTQEKRILADTWVGMLTSNVVAACIMMTAAAAFFTHGVHDIESTSQAASALEPVAGKSARLLFSLGLIGCGLLAIPSLTGSSAYALAGALRQPSGMSKTPRTARTFYAVIALCTVVGALVCFSPINPIKALYWSAVINGVVAVPCMVMVMVLSSRETVVGKMKNSRAIAIGGWVATALMTVCVAVMGYTMLT
ncbi:Nramp family divalent metal transporter [Pandoraea nosoerga]|uniref:Divalent metal cation transporter MntH n=1 Tax=Pandoraea nosoerga TaxID=2508296 RepID=A0A5E4UDU0_9BURK|nr:Nramp family divalent metal transporter [Pandoraea nosoerga]MBN4667149.1 Nramp family divalent metal transporter [Pandoraea nosoerga]MBN4677137.1 Nramp family divalent metal transporter [Pandoraea nosoerga]MBN4681826.1 Nramp family divalent metal transporter [Pandoraea nosoerga]MBN4746254.1 Nramp family divalent metal transporter [Pandoraea nosoerga]VVD98205.1 Divalent metal cation transporter MntH [Pandoraea nosoerga]